MSVDTLLQNYTLWKESLNSDGQQIHQCQQHPPSPQTIEHKKKHDIWDWKSRSLFGIAQNKCMFKKSNVWKNGWFQEEYEKQC
jgi:hypothetical protein